MESSGLATEVPSSLRKLARLVVRGFYSVEDTLIVDMLVRNPCMREDDICELLKFEKKMLRARIATLKNDKFIQVRLRMETGQDGKAQKVNYYFINYKTFVNVVKYKLDLMRKRMETEERDATSRASFKCPKCAKTFTDLEADQLFEPMSGEFLCTYCRSIVEEDMSALPKKDSRMQMARFNSQMEPLFELLRQVEGIKLAPEVLEPEPVDINTIRGVEVKVGGRDDGGLWSGELTRNQGLAVEETRVNVTISGDQADDSQDQVQARKERPVWMVDSTVIPSHYNQGDGVGEITGEEEKPVATGGNSRSNDDIMSVLLAHERKGGGGAGGGNAAATANSAAVASVLKPTLVQSDSSADEMDPLDQPLSPTNSIELLESEEDELVPVVSIGDRTVAITEVNDALIEEMTPVEKETYIQVYQEYYSHMYD